MSENKKLKVLSFVGPFAVFLIAAGWHFIYSDVLKSGITAAIAPVNESVWEHAKLFFIPAVLYYVILYFITGKKFPNFAFAHAVALLIMPALMLLLVFVYKLFIPESLAIDLVITFIVIATGQLIAYKLTVSKCNLSGPGYKVAAIAIFLGLLALFTIFTFNPPHCELFIDSKSGRYGI